MARSTKSTGETGKKWNIWFLAGFPVGITKELEEDALNKILDDRRVGICCSTRSQAASAAEYYVVRDATTKKCTVVETKPTSTTTTIVDNGTYKTKTEAETGMKTTKVCTSGVTDRPFQRKGRGTSRGPFCLR